MSENVALYHALVVIADLRRDLLNAHDHGNCELCDKLERDLLDARTRVKELEEENARLRSDLAEADQRFSDLQDEFQRALRGEEEK